MTTRHRDISACVRGIPLDKGQHWSLARRRHYRHLCCWRWRCTRLSLIAALEPWARPSTYKVTAVWHGEPILEAGAKRAPASCGSSGAILVLVRAGSAGVAMPPARRARHQLPQLRKQHIATLPRSRSMMTLGGACWPIGNLETFRITVRSPGMGLAAPSEPPWDRPRRGW